MVSFDGVNLIITLDSGVTEVNVFEDIYEDWKNWLLETPLNRRYPQALVSDGGKPLSSIINQGSYIFLNNNSGWRIRPPEENITVYLTGNLAVADTNLPAFVSTVGTYTAAILGLQPITQGVTPVMATQLAYASFEGGVTIDTINGRSGTEDETGTRQYPSNNMADALIIESGYNFGRVYFETSYTLNVDAELNGFVLKGHSHVNVTLTIESAADVADVVIRECGIQGIMDGGTTLESCNTFDITYLNGSINNSGLGGYIILDGAKDSFFKNCTQIIMDNTPTINIGATGQNLIMTGYVGYVKLVNSTSSSNQVGIGLNGGVITLDTATFTHGFVHVSGDGILQDELGNHIPTGTWNSGVTVINHLINEDTITTAVWENSKALTTAKFLALK